MLRLSILTLSYRQAFDDGRMDLMSFLDTCRELSVEGVDLHDSAFPAVDRASLLAVKRDCLDRGLDIPCIAISNNFARPAEELPADVQRTKTWIERAALLGAPQVRVFSGKPFSEDDRAASWDRCADALRECAEFGA
ncbi:MAG: TIM barrel protein, partial [Chloroflexota bacterium]|nr:TIM barrel protein [Chloroflexota bacterium]